MTEKKIKSSFIFYLAWLYLPVTAIALGLAYLLNSELFLLDAIIKVAIAYLTVSLGINFTMSKNFIQIMGNKVILNHASSERIVFDKDQVVAINIRNPELSNLYMPSGAIQLTDGSELKTPWGISLKDLRYLRSHLGK